MRPQLIKQRLSAKIGGVSRSLYNINGFVLATNLILLALITLIASSLFKNSINQNQMAKHFKLQSLSINATQSSAQKIEQLLLDKISGGADLTANSQGYFGSWQSLQIQSINWQDTTNLLTIDGSLVVIIYLGENQKLIDPDIGDLHHTFKVFIKSSIAGGNDSYQQKFYAFKI